MVTRCSEPARPRVAAAVVLPDCSTAAAGPRCAIAASDFADVAIRVDSRAVVYRPPREGWRVAAIDEDTVLATVGEHILARRTELGFSQRELAERAAVDRAFLARVEQGLRNPSVVVLAKVAHAMDTTVSWLTRDI